jgi:hypothetical protein
MTMPERSQMRAALEQMAEDIREEFGAAVGEAAQ